MNYISRLDQLSKQFDKMAEIANQCEGKKDAGVLTAVTKQMLEIHLCLGMSVQDAENNTEKY